MFARCIQIERGREGQKGGKENEGAVEGGRCCTSLLMRSREKMKKKKKTYRSLHRCDERKQERCGNIHGSDKSVSNAHTDPASTQSFPCGVPVGIQFMR